MRKRSCGAGERTPIRSYLNHREYSILRHVLKHYDSTEQRFMASLVEHCWRNEGLAKDLRAWWGRDDRFYERTRSHRGTISKLSDILEHFAKVRLQAPARSVYEFVPRCSFAVIEEV
jgi:hypothetical protein